MFFAKEIQRLIKKNNNKTSSTFCDGQDTQTKAKITSFVNCKARSFYLGTGPDIYQVNSNQYSTSSPTFN